MKPIISILCFTCLFAVATQAQQAKKISYFGSLQHGITIGSSDVDFTANLLNGIQYKSWIAAFGTGYDGYGVPGIPLTLYGQKNFTKLKHKPFAYLQGGIEIPLKLNDWDVKTFDNREMYNLKKSYMAEAGIGYQWKVAKKLQLMIHTGFSLKYNNVQELEIPMWWSPISAAPYEGRYYDIEYYYKRFTCRFGIIF